MLQKCPISKTKISYLHHLISLSSMLLQMLPMIRSRMIIYLKMIFLEEIVSYLWLFHLIWWILFFGLLMILRCSVLMLLIVCLVQIHLLSLTLWIYLFLFHHWWNGRKEVTISWYLEVILLIEPSNRFSHLYVRDGKILAAMSLSIKFVVNLTGQGQPIK